MNLRFIRLRWDASARQAIYECVEKFAVDEMMRREMR
jgi:hypothetical protein